MGFSVRAESVVELQLSCNVICMKTSIENPKPPARLVHSIEAGKKLERKTFSPIPKSINNTKSSVATFQLFSCVFKCTKTCFRVKIACVFFSGR